MPNTFQNPLDPSMLPPNASSMSNADIIKYINENYGYMGAFINDPELGPILIQAAEQGYDAARLFGLVYKTNWWQTHSDASRSWITLTSEDPASADKLFIARRTQIRKLASKLGATLSADQLQQLTMDTLNNGWDGNDLTDILTTSYSTPGTVGDLQTNADAIQSMADQYMIPVTSQYAFDLAQRMARGELSSDTVKDMFLQQAKAQYPFMTNLLESGGTPKDYYQPIVSAIASTLELNPNSIDLMGSGKYSALLGQNMTIAQAKAWARQQPEYMYTDQARGDASQFAYMILNKMGAIKI